MHLETGRDFYEWHGVRRAEDQGEPERTGWREEISGMGVLFRDAIYCLVTD